MLIKPTEQRLHGGGSFAGIGAIRQMYPPLVTAGRASRQIVAGIMTTLRANFPVSMASFPILVVDDDPDILTVLNLAAKTGFPKAEFSQVYDVTEAKTYISALDGDGPKLVLLDLNLKNSESGLDLLSFLRSDEQARLLPVIVLTISQLPADLQAAYHLGATSFTNKPFSLEDWVVYLSNLRHYWVDTVTLPPLWFTKKL